MMFFGRRCFSFGLRVLDLILTHINEGKSNGFWRIIAGEAKRLDGLPGRIDVQFWPEPHPSQAAGKPGEPSQAQAGQP